MATETSDLAAGIVAEARAWIGTPYRHQASLKGVGTDCLGLVRGVWRAVVGAEPEPIPAYTRDWGDYDGAEPLLAGTTRHLRPVGLADLSDGDVVLFRMVPGGPVKHCGIAATRGTTRTLVHAWSGHAVAEVPLDTIWRRRLVTVHRFPGA